MGDGMLAEFASVVDAVLAAVETQRAVAERNADVPQQKRIEFRVGFNLGDVVIDGDDIQGDGVNVAARLEALAEPGGIYVSAMVYEEVRDRIDIPFEGMGEQEVKNIARSIGVWRWSEAASAGPTVTASEPRALPDKPSIAVLPFDNMSGDPAQEYFADGLTEDIITALSLWRSFPVIARNSTFAYKGQSPDIRRVADELGARYVLEGSVRTSGERVRITAQLIDAESAHHVWAEKFDRKLEDIFELQDEITERIVATISPELERAEQKRSATKAPTSLTAWDCYQRGLWHLYRFTTEEIETAKSLFERAIALDPSFAQAYARLAYVHIQLGWYGPKEDRAERLKDATSLAGQAIELDGRNPAARLSLGRALTLSGPAESSVEELRVAVALDPSFAQAHFALGLALCCLERHDETLREIDEALRLSPRDPHLWMFLHVRAMAHYIADDLKLAEADERAALRQPNVTFWPYLMLEAILGRQGKRAEALDAIAGLRRISPGFTHGDAIREWYFGDHPFMTQRFIDQFAADVRNAGLLE